MNLEQIPQTLCSAAWTDINIDFSKRRLRHCCKSKWESFPEKVTASFINNSPRIEERRKNLIENIEHPDCDSCWQDYNIGKSAYRDHKNTWTEVSQVSNKIKYVELMFDNQCNMSCIYCSAGFSSRIAKENNEHFSPSLCSKDDLDNFVHWLTKICSLNQDPFTICFLGGEITLSQNFYNFMNVLQKNDTLCELRLHLSFLTNTNTPRPLFSKFINTLENLPANWTFDIGISNEAHHHLAEIVRWGLNWEVFKENFSLYLQHPKLNNFTLSPTPCLFTVGAMYDYFEWAFLQFRKYNKKFNVVGNWVENSVLDPAYADKKFKVNVASVYDLFVKNFDLFSSEKQYNHSLKWLESLELRVGSAPINRNEIDSLLLKWQLQKGERISLLRNYLSLD